MPSFDLKGNNNVLMQMRCRWNPLLEWVRSVEIQIEAIKNEFQCHLSVHTIILNVYMCVCVCVLWARFKQEKEMEREKGRERCPKHRQTIAHYHGLLLQTHGIAGAREANWEGKQTSSCLVISRPKAKGWRVPITIAKTKRSWFGRREGKIEREEESESESDGQNDGENGTRSLQ